MKAKGKYWSDLHEAIDSNLRHGDIKEIAEIESVDETFVSRVRHGRVQSQRILNALQVRAINNKKNLIEVTEYLNKPTKPIV